MIQPIFLTNSLSASLVCFSLLFSACSQASGSGPAQASAAPNSNISSSPSLNLLSPSPTVSPVLSPEPSQALQPVLQVSPQPDSQTPFQPPSQPPIQPEQVRSMQIRLSFSDSPEVLTVTLDGHATSRDFIAQLPLTIQLQDYAATEKISYLPRKLLTTGAPAGYTPIAGDFAYYAPWGNLALFYKGFSYSSGLIKLGRFNSGLEILSRPGARQVLIERLEAQ